MLSSPLQNGQVSLMRRLKSEDLYLMSLSLYNKGNSSSGADGKDYFFVSEIEFKKMIDEGGYRMGNCSR